MCSMKSILQLFSVCVLGILSAFFFVPALAFASNLGLSQTSLTMTAGQSTTISVTGGYILSITSNSNSSIATASVSGNYNEIIVNALSNGTTNINVCNPNNLCDTLAVTVGSQTTPISLSQTNVTLNVGQSQTITISGVGGNNLVSNSNPSSVTANVSGTTLYVSGSAYGGSNLNVCQADGQCAMVYVFVNGTPPSSTTSTALPTLSSLNVSSSDISNAFLGSESAITVAFTTTAPITNPYIIIAGSRLTANGSGNGPYSAIYSATGNESSPLLASINWTDVNGNNPTQIGISLSGIGNTAPSASVSTPAIPVSPTAPAIIGDGYKFINPLGVGSTGVDVTELQKRLTAESLYSGPITGYYGSLTETAVESFQGKVGLSRLGNVGPGTRAALNSGS